MANDRIEILVLKNLLNNEKYARKVVPYLKDHHFDNPFEREVFKTIQTFIQTYNSLPTPEAVLIELEEREDIKEDALVRIRKTVKKLTQDDDDATDYKWLVKKTERFCQEKELDYALTRSIEIREDPERHGSRGEITHIITEALGLSFDPNVGHDYLLDYNDAYDHYNLQEDKIPFDIELLNRATCGGIPAQTLNLVMAGSGVGKTMFMCHLASAYLLQGRNVLYITMEMSRFEIRRRIDANLFDVEMNQVNKLQKEEFRNHVKSLQEKTNGKLIIKQYPTASASTLHFKHLIDELRLKKKFEPDIIIIDYLNICQSSRVKVSSNSGSFAYMQSIAQEFRGLAGQVDSRIWTATQTNREGMKKRGGEMEMWDTSESIGVPFTADFLLGLSITDDVRRVVLQILKNRYNDAHEITKFSLGVDRKKMRFYDLDETESFDPGEMRKKEEMEDYEVGLGLNGHANGNGSYKGATQKGLSKTMKNFKGRGAFDI